MPQTKQAPPTVSIEDKKLQDAGFINSGKDQFKKAVVAFSDRLFEESTKLGDQEKAEGYEREISSNMVSRASSFIAAFQTSRKRSVWAIVGQILEYAFTAVAAYGGANWADDSGKIAFVTGSIATVILVAIRLAVSKKD